jgi:hypothetical protein
VRPVLFQARRARSSTPQARRLRQRSIREDFTVVDVLDCLKKYCQRLDHEIARETGVPLQTLR